MEKNNNLWVWGYTLKHAPGPMKFVCRNTYCSLETGAGYLGADNVVFMDSTHELAALDDGRLERVRPFKKVICGLTHNDETGSWNLNYVTAARRISELSKGQYPNISGAIIDDFRDPPGPSGKMTPAELKEIHDALKSVNPDLKLYVVRYHIRQDFDELLPFKDYFDGVNIWCWNSTDHFWKMLYKYDLLKLHAVLPGKEVLQGQFIHDFGTDFCAPMPLDQLELQCAKIGDAMREKLADGWVVLQNGFFDAHDHRKQMIFLKEYLEWFYGTWSR